MEPPVPPAPPSPKRINVRAVLVVIGISVSHVAGTQAARWSLQLSPDLSPFFVVWLSTGLNVILGLPVWLRRKALSRLQLHHTAAAASLIRPQLKMFRIVAVVGPFYILWAAANTAYIHALALMNTSLVIAIFSVTPGLVALLGVPMLRRAATPFVVAAVCASACGVTLIAQPWTVSAEASAESAECEATRLSVETQLTFGGQSDLSLISSPLSSECRCTVRTITLRTAHSGRHIHLLSLELRVQMHSLDSTFRTQHIPDSTSGQHIRARAAILFDSCQISLHCTLDPSLHASVHFAFWSLVCMKAGSERRPTCVALLLQIQAESKDNPSEGNSTLLAGVASTLVASACAALYKVLLRRTFGDAPELLVVLVLAFLGCWSVSVGSLLLCLLHSSWLEDAAALSSSAWALLAGIHLLTLVHLLSPQPVQLLQPVVVASLCS